MDSFPVNTKDLQDFCLKCDALTASKLILADKKITDLLKTLASSKDLCALLEYCLKDYNYKIEFLKSKRPDDAKKGKFVLSLPQGKDLIAYVFCLLCEFENKEKDLTEFLTEFYDYDELLAGGYLNFCNKVIKPFKETVLQLCSENDDETEEPQYKLKGETLEISNADYKKINKAYQALKKCIIKEAMLPADDRKEYIKVADAFIDSCFKRDKNLSGVLLAALKYMCLPYRFLSGKAAALEKIYNKI
jgi:hypothetical protein